MNRPNWRDLFFWAVGRKKRFVIEGQSMLPTLKPGDHVLVDVKTHLRRSLRPSEIVLFRQPNGELLMTKRIQSIDKEGLWVCGDNESQSSDSRDFGRVPMANVIGVVCVKVSD